MTQKAAEKIIEALTQLLEGFTELQENVENDFGATDYDDDEESERGTEIDTAVVTEMRAAIESVIETEDYSSEEIAAMISTVTDALAEIDPSVFEEGSTTPVDDEEDQGSNAYGEIDDDLYDDNYKKDDKKAGKKKKAKSSDDDEEENEEEDDDEEDDEF